MHERVSEHGCWYVEHTHREELTATECGEQWQTQCALSGAEWKQSAGALTLTVQNNAGALVCTDPVPVPRGLLTLCLGASSGPQGQ